MRFFVGAATMIRHGVTSADICATSASIEAVDEATACGLFTEWALRHHPGHTMGGVNIRDVTDQVMKFAANTSPLTPVNEASDATSSATARPPDPR